MSAYSSLRVRVLACVRAFERAPCVPSLPTRGTVPAMHLEQGAGDGATAAGWQEVEAAGALWEELGIRCRATEETMADMAEALLQVPPKKVVRA